MREQPVSKNALTDAIESTPAVGACGDAKTARVFLNVLRGGAQLLTLRPDGCVAEELVPEFPTHHARVARELTVEAWSGDTRRLLNQLATAGLRRRYDVTGGLSGHVVGPHIEMHLDAVSCEGVPHHFQDRRRGQMIVRSGRLGS